MNKSASEDQLNQISKLYPYYQAQRHGSFCGIASLSIGYNFLHSTSKCTQGRSAKLCSPPRFDLELR
jgi:hypothetical protein